MPPALSHHASPLSHHASQPLSHHASMYYWYKIKIFDETPEDKYEAETISLDYIFFSDC
jgi:hypothetical protein